MLLSSGFKLGRYLILAPLGAGGMGEVYRAKDLQLEREVAIKILPASHTDSPVALKRLEREARAVAALSHPNILSIHDFGTHEGIAYVVTELLEGRSLKSFIQKSPLSHQEAIKIGLSIAEGLHAAHSRGVVHRDLKPDNIFITSDYRVKILDFGLAVLKPVLSTDELTDASTASGASDEGMLNGTVPYMSPEQLRGKPVESRSDIFSFGSVLYEMIVGRPPFLRETVADSVAAILREEPPYEQELDPKVPAALGRVVRLCLEKNAAERLPDAHRLVLALNESVDTAALRVRQEETSKKGLKAVWKLFILTAVLIFIAISGFVYFKNLGRKTVPVFHSLAVLPLKNMSGDPNDDYLVDGITEEITSRLARLNKLRVISRTSAMHYKKSEKSLKEIGGELNVDVVLEGSLRRTGSRIRVVANLIQADSDRNIWSQTYDHEMNDILTLQSEVAFNVSRELRTQLSPNERAELAKVRSIQPEAYDFYLRGISHEQKEDYSKNSLLKEISLFRKAVQIDPNFALAYASLAQAHAVLDHFGFDSKVDHANKAKEAAERALEIEPDLAEANLALGYYYYWCLEDPDRALTQFEIASTAMPNNTKALQGIGYVQRRYGDTEAAVEAFKKAHQLSPKELRVAYELAHTLTILRRYAEADLYYDRAISIAPDQLDPYQYKIENYYLWDGRIDRAKATLQRLPDRDDGSNILYWFELNVMSKNYQQARELLESSDSEMWESRSFFTTKEQLIALTYRLSNQPKIARDYYKKAANILEKKLEHNSANPVLLSSLGLVYAGLSEQERAIAIGKKAVRLAPMQKDRLRGINHELDLVKIYVVLGKYDAALAILERLLSQPGLVSVPFLRLNPVYEPLLNHPGFTQLEKKFDNQSKL